MVLLFRRWFQTRVQLKYLIQLIQLLRRDQFCFSFAIRLFPRQRMASLNTVQLLYEIALQWRVEVEMNTDLLYQNMVLYLVVELRQMINYHLVRDTESIHRHHLKMYGKDRVVTRLGCPRQSFFTRPPSPGLPDFYRRINMAFLHNIAPDKNWTIIRAVRYIDRFRFA